MGAFRKSGSVRAGGRAARAFRIVRGGRSRWLLNRSQPGAGCEHLLPQAAGDRDLGQLEGDGSRMAHELGADLDQTLAQARQRPVVNLLGQREFPLMAINGCIRRQPTTSAKLQKADHGA